MEISDGLVNSLISSSHVFSCAYLSHSWTSSSSPIPSFDIFFFLIFQESSDPAYIPNPCYSVGYNYTMSASDIYDTECTKKPEGYNPDQELSLVGTGDSDKCNSIVLSIFDFETCNSSQCSFNGVEQPPVSGGFMVTHCTNMEHIQE